MSGTPDNHYNQKSLCRIPSLTATGNGIRSVKSDGRAYTHAMFDEFIV